MSDVFDCRSYALKISLDDRELRDGYILRELLDVDEVVDVFAYGKRFALVEYVRGRYISQFDEGDLEDIDYKDRMLVLIRELYEKGYVASDLNCDNVKYENGEIRIIDVGNFVDRSITSYDEEDAIIEFEELNRFY